LTEVCLLGKGRRNSILLEDMCIQCPVFYITGSVVSAFHAGALPLLKNDMLLIRVKLIRKRYVEGVDKFELESMLYESFL